MDEKNLRKLQLPEKENIRIVAIERDGEMDCNISGDLVLGEDTTVALTIPREQIYDLI